MSEDDRDDAPLGRAEQQRISDAVEVIAGQRAVIEQTKGILMFIYGIDADAAFDLLRWQSQEHNVKLRLIAEQIQKDLIELSKADGPGRRLELDGLMLTAHRRVASLLPQDESTTDPGFKPSR